MFLQKLVKPSVTVGADPKAAFADQTPATEATAAAARQKKLGSTADALTIDPRPAPERAQTEEAGAPAGARSQVTTVTKHLLRFANDKKIQLAGLELSLLLQVDAEPQKKKPSSATATSPPSTVAQLPQSELKVEKLPKGESAVVIREEL